ncbi:hypothetical protein ACWT_4606 [Actinoplanes sp. SE50]|uniref:GNAT family N-acetyltransferase n=1 Tax=unclassified Actinoplanes TaxID=2626549 RepID=UPI00023ED484|nr:MULTISPECIES: GNAT family N-acetyltransferase [unclassified Actinoplanes]AEV85628.1 hypothetical protein ACPL_4737 [Actinoplanes sp. SE50/110]ATO84021.1 hypothetical protein ACWT_4606 [Actinoplanes sp. SE50]SLM01431.1 GNAT family N-acetyltransferase [Actinoplanes sp. SE50/110]
MQIRPFARGDREQVTALVNAHVAAVVPGLSVSVQTLLSQLEREPGETVVDPWVTARVTIVAEERQRVVAAAHLLRYDGAGDYRDAGEIRWLVCRPEHVDAGDALALAGHALFRRWGVARRLADGGLPAPGVYGVPAQWPHVRGIYERAGFRQTGRTETVHLARVADLARQAVPLPGLTTRRTVGGTGTRIAALRGAEQIGYIEVDTDLDGGPRMSRAGCWADVGNLWIEPACRRRGVGSWLLGQAADWLDLGGTTRLLDYADEGEDGYAGFLTAVGFTVLTSTGRRFTA